jgi:hypothetical protein
VFVFTGFQYLVRIGSGDELVDGDGNLRIYCGAPCPWDCQDTPDGMVSVTDLLAMLAQWGGPGSCDFDGGGVSVTDLLVLLANWGPCPP